MHLYLGKINFFSLVMDGDISVVQVQSNLLKLENSSIISGNHVPSVQEVVTHFE